MVNKHFFQKVSRTVYFKYYYGKDTADPDRPDVAPSVTHAGKDVNAGGPNGMLGDFKVDNKNSNTTTFIDSPQIENPTAEDNEILRAIVTGRDTDLVTGLVNNQGNENLGYISGATSIIQFPEVDAVAKDDWTTYDPNVPASNTENTNSKGTYWFDSMGRLNNGATIVSNPPAEYLYYFHNQSVDITFEDVTDASAAKKLSAFNLKDPITAAKNMHYALGEKHRIKKNANKNYEKYNYNTADNTYTATDITVNPNDTISQSTNYEQVLKAYEDAGYKLVATEFPENNSKTNNGLDYDPDSVWAVDSTDTENYGHQLVTKHIAVKLIRDQVPVLPGSSTFPPNVQEKDKKATENGTTTRVIKYFDGKTGDSLEKIAPTVTQTLTWGRAPVYDKVTGEFKGYAKLDDKGQVIYGDDGLPIINTAIKDDGDDSWSVVSTTNNTSTSNYDDVTSPDLTDYGYKKVPSLTKTDDGSGQQSGSETAEVGKDGKEVDIYYFHDTQNVDVDHPFKKSPKGGTPDTDLTKDQLEKTATRTITYTGDNYGKIESVDGSPEKTASYEQSTNFEIGAKVDKVTGKVLGYYANGDTTKLYDTPKGAWDATNEKTLDKVDSQKPSDVGYDFVDKASVDSIQVKPDDNLKDTVQYSKKVAYNIHYHDVTDLIAKGQTTGFDANSGTDLGHEVKNINGKVGDKGSAPQDSLWDYAAAGYILVSAPEDLNNATFVKDMGDIDDLTDDQYVYLVRANTPVTPSDNPDYPSNVKDQDKKATQVTQTRKVTYWDASNNNASLEDIAPTVTQKVTYGRTAIYDKVNGNFLGYAKLDANGKPITDDNGLYVVDKTLDDNNSWKLISSDNGNKASYAQVDSPDLTAHGYQAQMSFNDQHNDGDAATVSELASDPAKDGGETKVYYYHDTNKTDQQEKTATRTITYVGEKLDGTTEDVNGSPDKTATYTQTAHFTITALSDKVNGNVLGYYANGDTTKLYKTAEEAWDATNAKTLDAVKSQDPSNVGYDYVDKENVSPIDVKPDDALTDKVVYTKKVSYNVHYIDVTDSIVSGKTTGFTPDNGTDLGHEVTNISGRVNTTPDRTSDLWKNYEAKGYVLVENPSGDSLAKTTLTKDTGDQYVYLARVATPHTETKEATRTIHYVGLDPEHTDVTTAPQIQADTQQSVSLTGTYYTDATKKDSTDKVNVKTITINGKEVIIVDTTNKDTPETTWKSDSSTGVSENDKKYDFAQVTDPDTIGQGKDTWYHVSKLDQDNGKVTVDPNSSDWKNTLPDGYLPYKQKNQYNIHYIDVNGVEDKAAYVPTDGKELDSHLISLVGKDNFIGDNPDATNDLWTTYADQGYVLVGLSDNAKNDKLGKQTITKDVQDQYVYLKHAVKTITPSTPTSEIPKNPDGTPVVNPADLHKEFNRTISYKANTVDGPTLMDQTKQHTEFNGSVIVDLVTGKAVVPETVKDVDSNDVEVATNTPGKITWDKENYSFSEIKQPLITLGKDDKYATSDDMVGTWHQISGKADRVDLTPDSGNPADEVLIYEKDKKDTGIPLLDPEKPAITIDQEVKRFTRTVVYRGTRDGGKTYQDVNGSPDGKNVYKQTITFTRNVLKDEKGTVLSTTDWVPSMPQVDSKTPSEVGYDKVDKDSVEKIDIDPNSSQTDLGTVVVTYESKPVTPDKPTEKTYSVTVHYVDEDGNVIKNPVKDDKDYKSGEDYDENSKKDSTISYNGKTYEFVKVQDGDKPAGTIEDKDVDVTYVYKLKETPVTPDKSTTPEPSKDKHQTTVEYVTEDGKKLIPSISGQSDLINGSNFNNAQAKKETITVDGKTYKLVAESNVSNKIAGKDQVTRFVYEEVIPSSENDEKNVAENHSSDHTEPSTENHNADMPAQEKVNNETMISKPSKQDGQQNVVASTRKLSSDSFTSEKQQITGQKSNTFVNKAQSKRTLPQTGAKQNTLAYVGMGVSVLAGLLGLAFTDHKKKRN